MWDSDTAPAGPGICEPALAESTVEVIETMFFEFPIDEVREGPAPSGAGSTVEFTGTRPGRFEVAADYPAALRLAGSFLGRENDATVTAPEVELVLLELANILCGNVLSRLEPRGGFEISAPRMLAREAEECGAGWLVAPLESGRVAVRLTFSGQR